MDSNQLFFLYRVDLVEVCCNDFMVENLMLTEVRGYPTVKLINQTMDWRLHQMTVFDKKTTHMIMTIRKGSAVRKACQIAKYKE